MGRYKVTDPTTGQSLVLNGDSPPTEQELTQIFASVPKPAPYTNLIPKQNTSMMAASGTISNIANKSNPYQPFQQMAPSNLMKLIGVGSANAPGVTGAVLNSLPGVGNPLQLMSSLRNVGQNPGQIKQGLRRIGEVQGGEPLKPEEIKPALTGQVLGTALEMAATPALTTENIVAKGPFKAGLKMPSTILPGSFEKAGAELGAAKVLARAGENASDASRFRVMLQKPSGVVKIAEEAKMILESGKEVPTTNLLAYREALGKMQAEGGSFAHDYKLARDIADKMLAKQAPELVSKLKTMATNFAARGNPKASFPWLTFGLNPQVGAVKAATLPVVQNIAGAAINPIVTNPGKIAALVNSVPKVVETEKVLESTPTPKILTKEKAYEFVRDAKNNKKKARRMAKDAGYTWEGDY